MYFIWQHSSQRSNSCEVPMPPSRDFISQPLNSSTSNVVRSLPESSAPSEQVWIWSSSRKQDSKLVHFKERNFVRSLAETAGYPSLAAYLPHLTSIPHNPFLPKPEHPFFLSPASSFHFSSLFSGDLGKPGRRRKARTVFSDAQLAGLERRWVLENLF